MFTIEVNTDQDPMKINSWHIDDAEKIFETNMRHVINKNRSGSWILVGLQDTFEQAQDASDILRCMIAREINKKISQDGLIHIDIRSLARPEYIAEITFDNLISKPGIWPSGYKVKDINFDDKP